MSAPSPPLLSLISTLVLLLLLSTHASAAHRQHVFKPTAAAASATALASAAGYSYVGCWNETTGYKSNGGARALERGKTTSDKKMTINTCLSFCSSPNRYTNNAASYSNVNVHPMQYAALSYGRECWCGQQLSELSEKLNERERCIYSCDGNSSQVCGGLGALTLYNLTAVELKTGRAWSQFSGAAGYGSLAVITLVIAAVL